MESLPSALRPATLRSLRKHGVAGAAFIVRVTSRRFDGFVATASASMLELTPNAKHAWVFATAREARGAVNLALGLGAACCRVAVTSIEGQV